jgi:hypothetical protein
VFELAGTIHFLGVLFYGAFASGELQSWGEPPADPNKIPNWKIRQMSIKGPPSGGSQGQQSFDQGGGPTRPPAPSIATYGAGGQGGVQTTLAATSGVMQSTGAPIMTGQTDVSNPVVTGNPQAEYDWNAGWNEQQSYGNAGTSGGSQYYSSGPNDSYRQY